MSCQYGQLAILTFIRPLTSAWQHLTDEGLEEDPEILVPGVEVLSLIQPTLCLCGNASELTTHTQRVKILEAINRPWGRFGSDEQADVYKCLASMVVRMRDQPYSHVMVWIGCRLRFSLLRSSITFLKVCCRIGTQSHLSGCP